MKKDSETKAAREIMSRLVRLPPEPHKDMVKKGRASKPKGAKAPQRRKGRSA